MVRERCLFLETRGQCLGSAKVFGSHKHVNRPSIILSRDAIYVLLYADMRDFLNFRTSKVVGWVELGRASRRRASARWCQDSVSSVAGGGRRDAFGVLHCLRYCRSAREQASATRKGVSWHVYPVSTALCCAIV